MLDRPRLHCVQCVTRGLLKCHSSRITRVHDWQSTTLRYERWYERCGTSRLDLDLDNSRQEPEAITATRRSSSSTTVCHGSCTTICTDLTFLNVSNTRLASQCTDVCRVRHPSTWPTIILQSQRLLADATYARPVDITHLYHVTGSVPSAVEPSLLQVRRSRQSPRPGSQQQKFQATTQDGLLQPLLSTLSAAEMLYDSALYKMYDWHWQDCWPRWRRYTECYSSLKDEIRL